MKNTNTQSENSEKIIVHFHTGRGGHYNNPGHRQFLGEKSFPELVQEIAASDNYSIVNRDEHGRFCKPYYITECGREMLTVEEAHRPTGHIDTDGEYDSDECRYIDDLNYRDIFRIIESAKDPSVAMFMSDRLIDWLHNWIDDGIQDGDSEILAFVAEHGQVATLI